MSQIGSLTELRAEIQKAKEAKKVADERLAALEQELKEVIDELQSLGGAVQASRQGVTQSVGQSGLQVQLPDAALTVWVWIKRFFWAAVLFFIVLYIFSLVGKQTANGECSPNKTSVESQAIQTVKERHIFPVLPSLPPIGLELPEVEGVEDAVVEDTGVKEIVNPSQRTSLQVRRGSVWFGRR